MTEHKKADALPDTGFLLNGFGNRDAVSDEGCGDFLDGDVGLCLGGFLIAEPGAA